MPFRVRLTRAAQDTHTIPSIGMLMVFCETNYVITRTMAAFPHLQDLADLGQGESQTFGLKDELKSLHVFRSVNPIPRIFSRRFWKELLPFIEPHRLNRHPRLFC